MATLAKSTSTSTASSVAAAAAATKATTRRSGSSNWLQLHLLLPALTMLLVSLQLQTCECRYLPTRSHGNDLDKLRELMLQILESSNEDQQQQQQRPPNEANGNTLSQRASWLNKLSSMDALDAAPKRYGSSGGHGGLYDSGRYY